MRSTYEERVSGQIEIVRHLRRGDDNLVGQTKFYLVCKALWKDNTAAKLAAATSPTTAVRTGERWLSGESSPPTAVVLAVMREIFGR